MILGELIEFLERQDPLRVVTRGFGRPHSYRMDYSQVAFEPAVNVTVDSMLINARGAIGPTFIGWKGGEYEFDERTEAFIAEYGDPGQPVDIMIIRLLEDDVALLKDEIKRVRGAL
jgi:hypothetical protein